MISLIPWITIPPLVIIIMNVIVFLVIIIKTIREKKYKILFEPEATLLEHTYHINALALSSDEKLLASCGGDNYAIIWDNVRRKVCEEFRMMVGLAMLHFLPKENFSILSLGKVGFSKLGKARHVI
jgi:hypothetical protein